MAASESFQWNPDDYRKVVDCLEDGDIICRCKDNFISHFVKYTSVFDPRFSHVGIIEKKNGKCYVIHSIGMTGTGHSRTIKESLKEFTNNTLDWEIYRIDRNIDSRHKICQIANTKLGIKYDYLFSLFSDTRLYCSELVYKCTNQALQEEFFTPQNIMGFPIMLVSQCYCHKDIHSIVHLERHKVKITNLYQKKQSLFNKNALQIQKN